MPFIEKDLVIHHDLFKNYIKTLRWTRHARMWMWPNYVDLLQQAAEVDLQKNAELAQRRIQVQINSILHAFLPLAR